MNRTSLARRYAPLAALAAVQLLIIATVPSTAPSQVDVAADAGSVVPGVDAGTPTDPGAVTDDTVVADGAVDPATGQPAAGAGAAAGAAAGSTATGGGGGGGAAGGGGATGGGQAAAASAETAPTGDTSHCKDGRQFDPAIYFYAPKCAGKFTGKNPGATYQGVTDTEIKVIVYRGKPNPQVDAILDAIGSNPPDEWQTDFMERAFEFINANFELYGRKIKVEEFKGTCDTVPPNYVCLRGEMRDLVRDKKPFLVLWGTPLASPAFDELSALKVVNVGGQHFRNNPFSLQRRPYHWDAAIPGDVAAKHVAEFYCKRLHDKPAKWAGETGTNPSSQNVGNDIRSKKRVLGVISTDDPENLNTIKQVLKPELAKCGATVAHEFYYAQDIARAEEQRRLALAKMRENTNGGESTSIMCFCDGVAPLFLYRSAQEQNYFPEHIVVGIGANDSDAIGQSYDFGSTLCPDCHQYENAFGLRSIGQAERFTSNAAVRLYKAAGGKVAIDWDKYKGAIGELDYFMMIGTLLQGAGPALTPANLEKGAFAQGSRGGFADINDPHFNKRGFRPGNYGWINDMDQVYWSQTQVSESMGDKGTYVQIDGRRFDSGEFPEGEPTFPNTKPR
jgi:hypothetical protein